MIAPVESITCTLTPNLPLCIGVPEIEPTPPSERIGGRPPLGAVKVYGATPPLAWSVAEKGTPTFPPGSDDVVIVSGDGDGLGDAAGVAVGVGVGAVVGVGVAVTVAVGVEVAVRVGVAAVVGVGVGVADAVGVGVALGVGLETPEIGDTVPHQVPQVLLVPAYSCIVHMSRSLIGSTTVAL